MLFYILLPGVRKALFKKVSENRKWKNIRGKKRQNIWLLHNFFKKMKEAPKQK